MSKYTLKMGRNATYLCNPSDFYVAKSHGTTKEDYDSLQEIADKLNRLEALERSHAELVEAIRIALPHIPSAAIDYDKAQSNPASECWVSEICQQALSRAQSLTSTTKPPTAGV